MLSKAICRALLEWPRGGRAWISSTFSRIHAILRDEPAVLRIVSAVMTVPLSLGVWLMRRFVRKIV